MLECGRLERSSCVLAVLFQRNHVGHTTALERAIKAQGDVPALSAAHTSHTSLGEGLVAPKDPQTDLVVLARLERALCQTHLKAAAGHPDALQAPLLMRLAAQCAVQYGALAQAAGEPLEA